MRWLLTAAALAASVSPGAPASAQVPVQATGQVALPAYRSGDYPFHLFVPPGYESDPRQRWPLLIFLHGSGERGTDLAVVTKWGPPHIVADHPGTPMLIVSPQLEPGGDWDVAKLDRLLADVRKRYRIDQARISLTGLSLGGMATWRWALAHPDLFAAIAPVAAKTPIDEACKLKDLPIWAFHGDDDGAVPVRGDVDMVDAVRACAGAVKPKLTVYPATDHFSWIPAYDDPALWRWLSEQRRPR
jgi:predicted peptidase